MNYSTAFYLMSPAFQKGTLLALLEQTYPAFRGASFAERRPKDGLVTLYRRGIGEVVGKCKPATIALFVDAKLWTRKKHRDGRVTWRRA